MANSLLASSGYPRSPPLVALVAAGRAPATNLRLTEALADKAAELTREDDESVKLFELCSWVITRTLLSSLENTW